MLIGNADVGLALMEVRDRRLYKDAGYNTFEKYCIGRWGWKRAHAYRLVEAAKTVQAISDTSDDLSPIGDIPNESTARELAPLARTDPDAARETWRDVVEESESTGEPITAAKVRQAVKREQFDDGWNTPEVIEGEYVTEPEPAREHGETSSTMAGAGNPLNP